MLDRRQAPPIQKIDNISIPEIEVYPLPNGRKLYAHREYNTNSFRLEVLTSGGHINAQTAAEVQLGVKMLGEGTHLKSGHQISDYIDSLGSFLEISPGFDHSSFSILGLKKFFKENVSILAEMIYDSAFKPQSFDILKKKEINKLNLNLEKGSYISSVNLRNSLFKDHAYGLTLDEQSIKGLSIDKLKYFHSSCLKSFDIYLSGDLPESFEKIIQDAFNTNQQKNDTAITSSFRNGEKIIELRAPKYIQSSIKIGQRIFTRAHPDYFKFIVTNEIFGGYFGSRLMKNIREEKGYTYGIYSALYSLNQSGYYLISTDVKGDYEKETLQEIDKEAHRLSSELIGDEELDTVKSYMIGSFVNSITSPFASITKFKTVNTQSLDLSFYKNYISNIRSVSKDEVMQMAQIHLQMNSFTKSIVGM